MKKQLHKTHKLQGNFKTYYGCFDSKHSNSLYLVIKGNFSLQNDTTNEEYTKGIKQLHKAIKQAAYNYTTNNSFFNNQMYMVNIDAPAALVNQRPFICFDINIQQRMMLDVRDKRLVIEMQKFADFIHEIIQKIRLFSL